VLGEFEYLILTVAATLDENAYGAAIRVHIEEKTGRQCSLGALYTTIERLEAKGLLNTWMGDATPQRGGRAKRMVRVTSKGMRAGKEFYEAITRISVCAAWAPHRLGAKA
jgi:PadR family transcriptional regulator, regulatory protein PadR